MKDKPSVYYPFPFPQDDGSDFTWAVCVDECPNQGGSPGDAFGDPPNQCMQPFQVPTTARSRLLGALAVVNCGGLPKGKTDMTQFGAAGFAGYYQYCLKSNPVCSCDGYAKDAGCTNTTCSSTCCTPPTTGTAQDAIGQQIGVAPLGEAVAPMFESLADSNSTPEMRQFGIPLGHQYGFCFIPYPTYLPGQGSSASWTRCIPLFGNNTDSYNASLSKIGSSFNTSSNANSSTMEAATKSVLESMSGPRETVMGLVEQVLCLNTKYQSCCKIQSVVGGLIPCAWNGLTSLSLSLSLSLSICLSIHAQAHSIYLSVCLSVCLSIHAHAV